MRISGLGLRQAIVQTRDRKHVSCEACYLVRVRVRRSDTRLEGDFPFHAITKVPMILDTSTVLMMGMKKGINEAHHLNPILLKASQEHTGDQVMEKMVSPWKHRSLPLNKGTHCTREDTRSDERESRAHLDIQLDTFVPHLQCEIFVTYIARCKGCARNQW